jgi:hypothetical protein
MRPIATPLAVLAALGLTACGTQWSVVDVDGDGYTTAEGDCWDAVEGPPGTGLTGADISPGAAETWYDGIDQDCQGDDDYDADGDGFVPLDEYEGRGTLGVPDAGSHLGAGDCWDAPVGTVAPEFEALNGLDQPDAAAVFPGAESDAFYDGIDQDCDGSDDFDADGDGFASGDVEDRDGNVGDDCDDAEPAVNPAVEFELCNDIDDDCDGLVDGDDDNVDPDGVRTWYADADGDGFGDAAVTELSCSALDGYVEDDATDCDDGDAGVNPGAQEICSGADEDCDGLVDDDDDSVDATEGGVESWADVDGDGYGDPFSGGWACEAPAGNVDNTLDCDDTDFDVSPDATEVCDGADNDCDGLVDDDDDSIDLSTTTTYYSDLDGDGYGDASTGVESCRPPSDTVTDATDCDDGDAGVNPGATESVGDGVDSDCDGTETCYVDADDDGYRPDTSTTVVSADSDCDDSGEALDSDPWADCDDSDPTLNPGETDLVGDGIDSDCDGTETCYVDADDDGYADSSGATVASADGDCSDSGEALASAPQTDCDDAESAVNPGEDEVCNDGLDNDCDAATTCAISAGSLADANLKLQGEGGGHAIAQTLHFLGDVDGDGIDDLAVGSPLFDSASAPDRGAAYIMYGSLSGVDPSGSATSGVITEARRFQGSQNAAQAGRSVSGGDIDGDGINEVIVGAPGGNGGAGRTWLLSGPVTIGAAVANLAATATQRPGDAEHAGWAVALNGDTDADGAADVLIASPQSAASGSANEGPGVVTLLLGSDVQVDGFDGAAGITYTGSSTGEAVGYSVDWIDLDGDGLSDAAMGAHLSEPGSTPNNAGAVYVIAGPATSASTVDTQPYLGGGAAGDWLGWAISGGADVDGDGYEDLLAGAPTADDGGSNSGAVEVVRGSATALAGGAGSLSSWATIAGADSNDRLGQSVAGAGDVDGDGNDDLVVGAWKENTVGNNAGAAYLVFGPLTAGTTDLATAGSPARLTGESAGDLAGWSVAGGGDVNGDGLNDILVGSPQDDDGGTDAGAAYLLLGLGG